MDYEFYRQPLKNFRNKLLFIHPRLEEAKLNICYPPKEYGDISTNAIRFLNLNYGDYIYTEKEFIKMVDMFVPNEKIEIKNGMLNIWFPIKDLIKIAEIINK